MRDERARAARDLGQLLLDETAEEAMERDRWQDRVARLLEAEDRLQAQVARAPGAASSSSSSPRATR